MANGNCTMRPWQDTIDDGDEDDVDNVGCTINSDC